MMVERDEEWYYEKAKLEIELVGESEKKAWLQHPLTHALKFTLLGDQTSLCLSWGGGELTAETEGGTIQLNSKAIGGMQVLSDILEWVVDPKLRQEEENDEAIDKSVRLQGYS